MGTPIRILVVDDEPDIRNVLSILLASRGYVDMTLDVIRGAGVAIVPVEDGFDIPGGQVYRPQTATPPEGDWSGAAFWYAANAIGNRIAVEGMNADSRQPDRRILEALPRLGGADAIDVNEFPDSFPALAVAAACTPGTTVFTGISATAFAGGPPGPPSQTSKRRSPTKPKTRASYGE